MRPTLDGMHRAVTRSADSQQTSSSTSSRLIAMAIGLVGDPETVRQRIDCTPVHFSECCAGIRELGNRELGLLIDLIIQQQKALIDKHREITATVRQKNGFPREGG